MNQREPTKFGKYLLLERIGVGGMAEVYKAKLLGAEGFERIVAIKRILPHLVEDDDFVKMFVDEAKIAVRLSHPNIVAIDDLGKVDGSLFIGMEYVLGRDLRAVYDREKARRSITPVGIAVHIVMKMCEALHHAHFATGPRGEPLQVIHRDVSPQNVLISFDGEVKVADFGLAKARGRMVQTQAGVVKGKLAYMSPEQLRGDEIDHRVDVFGLGIVLFELLTAQRLFLGPSDMDTLRKVYDARVPPMSTLNPEIDAPLETIVKRALAKDREERYQTALELHDDLQSYVYARGVYSGTSSLRGYIADAFPDHAPARSMPPFAKNASPPTPPPPRSPPASTNPPAGPTIRPPALPTNPPGAPFVAEILVTEPVTGETGFDDMTNSDLMFDLDSEVDALTRDPLSAQVDAADVQSVDDEPETDRPAPMETIQERAPARAERSGTIPADRLPSMPAGIYEGAAERDPATLRPEYEGAPARTDDGDTPASLDASWGDEPTKITAPVLPPAPVPPAAPESGTEPGSRKRPAAQDVVDEEEDWDTDSTVVGDPRTASKG